MLLAQQQVDKVFAEAEVFSAMQRKPGMRPTLARLTLAGLTVVLCGGQSCIPTSAGEPVGETDVRDNDHVLAVGDPLVTVFEYSDFQCPFCQRFATETYPTIKADYIDTGKVRWVFRHLPLRNIHEYAQPSAEAAECAADQNAFDAYHDLLFENSPALTDANLKAYAGQLGLDQTTFDGCLDSRIKADRVQEDLDTAVDTGVSGSPSFVIDGVLHTGTRSAPAFAALLDEALANAAELDTRNPWKAIITTHALSDWSPGASPEFDLATLQPRVADSDIGATDCRSFISDNDGFERPVYNAEGVWNLSNSTR